MIRTILCLIVAAVSGLITANYLQFGWDLRKVVYMHQYGFMVAFPIVAGCLTKVFFVDGRNLEERADAKASAWLKERTAKLEKEFQQKNRELDKLLNSNKQRVLGLIDLEEKTKKLYELQQEHTRLAEIKLASFSEAETVFQQLREKVKEKKLPPAAEQDHLSRLDKKETKFRALVNGKAEPSQGGTQ